MSWWNIIKVQVLGSKQKVKMGLKPLPKEDDKPIPENAEPPNCKEYVVEIDHLIQDFIQSFDVESFSAKLNELLDDDGENRKGVWPSMNYTGRVPHREASSWYYFREFSDEEDPMELPAMNYRIMEHPVAYCNFIWASGDNISEKDACQLLELINLSSDYESLISIDDGYDITEFESTEYWNRGDFDQYGEGFGFDQVIKLRVGLRTMGNYSQYNKNKLPLEREKEIHKYLNKMNLETKLFFSSIFRIAKRWKDAGGTLKKSAEHPLGPITEYHGTMDIERVMKQGLHGGKTNKRSNKHIPKQLRKAERITYSSDNKKEALKFAQGRARQLGIALTKVGVVGIRARDLEEPIEHIDSRWVERGASVLVREGGIAVKYLERV
mgnify:CR=1 FL=1